MLATRSDAVKEYATNIGYTCPLSQWILSDYDSWVANPHYIGPDLGHPECEESAGVVFDNFCDASSHARFYAKQYDAIARVEHYKNRCWVVWY